MKKWLAVFSVLILAFATACSSSGGSSSSSSPSGSPGSSGSSDSSNETFTFITTTHGPAEEIFSKTFDAYLDKIEERSGGRIKFERYYAGALSDGFGVVDQVNNGVADVATVIVGWQQGKLPFNGLTTNPGLWDDVWAANMAYNELQKQIPELDKELESLGVVNIGNALGNPQFVVSTKPINTLEDFKGKQVITLSPPEATIMGQLGATPVGMSLMDAYDAMSRSIVDAITLNIDGALNFGLQEPAKYSIKTPIGTLPGMYVMSKKAWDRLPDDLKQIILEVKAEHPNTMYEMIYKSNQTAEERFKAAGGTVVTPAQDELKRLEEITSAHVWDAWAKEMEGQGLPGEKALSTFKELVDKYTKENPNK